MLEFIFALALVWLVAATIQDIRKREIPNWLSFSLIIFALAFRALYSVFYSDIRFFLLGLLGLGIFFILAEIFYYARVFAGGDSKFLISLGCILPGTSLYLSLIFLGFFIFILMFVGGFYGLVYSLVLVSLNRNNFAKEFKKQLKMRKMFVVIGLVLALLSLIFVFYIGDGLFLFFPLIIIAFPFLYIYSKAIEESCMIKLVNGKEVTVGDWLYEEVRVGRKKIKPYWEGLSEEEVRILKGYRGKVKVKYGIPFMPAFLISFILFILAEFLWYSYRSFFDFFLSYF